MHVIVLDNYQFFFLGVFIHSMKDENYGNECVQNHVAIQILHRLKWLKVVKFVQNHILYTRQAQLL